MCGGRVVAADRADVCSKTCPACGVLHEGDVNAAINRENLGVRSTVSALGEENSGSGRKTRVERTSVKQETSRRFTQQ